MGKTEEALSAGGQSFITGRTKQMNQTFLLERKVPSKETLRNLL
jgi:hypothetical protein